jgi:HAMP domain-containing protein
MAPAAERKMKVIPQPNSCDGCEVMKLRSELNEQNVNSFRMEMAERWRLQEEANKAMQESVGKLSSSINTFVSQMHLSNKEFLERIHKLEKNLVYVAITVIVAAALAWAPKVF